MAILVPNVQRGLKTMWKKVQKFAKKIGDLLRNFVSLLFHNCFLHLKCFQASTGKINIKISWDIVLADFILYVGSEGFYKRHY